MNDLKQRIAEANLTFEGEKKPMVGRLISQISSHPGAFGTGSNKTCPGVYALCTDGSLWWRAQGRDHTWTQLPAIPMEDQCAP